MEDEIGEQSKARDYPRDVLWQILDMTMVGTDLGSSLTGMKRV